MLITKSVLFLIVGFILGAFIVGLFTARRTDYGSIHHPKAEEAIKTIKGICLKCDSVIDRHRTIGDKPTARLYCQKCLGK